ncbi:hypothetical protein CFOL_v3_16282, partial [Cephalotus follicularis]
RGLNVWRENLENIGNSSVQEKPFQFKTLISRVVYPSYFIYSNSLSISAISCHLHIPAISQTMAVLRSREILPEKPTPKTLKRSAESMDPLTPAKTFEHATHKSPLESVPTRRRSHRLASKSIYGSTPIAGPSRKRKSLEGEEIRVLEEKEGILKEINGSANVTDGNLLDGERGVLSLRSGKRVVKRRMKNEGDKLSGGGNGEIAPEIPEKELSVGENAGIGSEVRSDVFKSVDKKGKSIMSDVSEVGVGGEILERGQFGGNESGGSEGKRRYSIEEKGKGKVVNLSVIGNEILDSTVEPQLKNVVDKNVVLDNSTAENVVQRQGRSSRRSNKRSNESRAEQFRDIARQNASRFAHFDSEEPVENHLSLEEGRMEMESGEEETNRDIEDWPGPFSTALRIIRDRADKPNLQKGTASAEKTKSAPIMWIPKGHGGLKVLVPSLQELCMAVLAKNADAISSLQNVPDALRHKLSQVLCDSRRMNSHFFNLLVIGSPTEIRLRDCSWLTEEQFTKSFEGCETNNLVILQLDQCGRCMPDYVVPATLARATNCLPLLTTLSLAGACRLSNAGLSALVSSAPALRSINLSQCSLITHAGIDTLANSLGSVLRELYLNDCQSIDPMLILPALKKLDYLEVLSLVGIEMVCDDFVREFITACGHNMKELVLADCVKLTDSSLKLIAEKCSGLCALDISNLCKLTDSAIGYLANGGQAIHALKLCRNVFSDEAIAAYLETSGESLKELSLNNVRKVAHHTALSLAKRSVNLQSLDLSWCRNLTNEAVGLIVDSCTSLRMVKLFGCTQITNVFVDGHSNPGVQIVGLKMTPLMEHLKVPDPQEGPLHYSSVYPSL